MQKQAPSIGRILVAVGFTLSCFALMLFLWISFGGPIPLKPKSYRITAYFPEATQLAIESDVRIGGVSVGKVRSIELAPPEDRVKGEDTTEAVIEIEPQFAPISTDARAILRQKTLLGETYVELTSGTNPDEPSAPVSFGAAANTSDAQTQDIESIPEGGTLGIGQTQNATQIDEIFNALDKQTRTAFQRWQQNAAVAIDGQGASLNDAFGNLGPFVSDASNILSTLRRQKVALQGLVHDTGTVFNALSERDQELAGAITGSNDTFGALASQNQALADTFKVFPVFQHESELTLARLDQFQANTRPLIQKLLPVANDISPTLRSVRELSPHLRNLFVDLGTPSQPGTLSHASKKGLPAAADVLHGLRPVVDALDPFLANLNPVIAYLRAYRTEVTNFLTGPPSGMAALPSAGRPSVDFGLRVLSLFDTDTLSVYRTRLATNRGNGYLFPNSLNGTDYPKAVSYGIFPNFDCKNTDYKPNELNPDTDEGEIKTGHTSTDPNNDVNTDTGGQQQPSNVDFAACFIQKDFPDTTQDPFGGGRAPNLGREP
jgi:phospholipid/cholesterol/gamma-HCH transport system substrate-binding protein